MARATRMAEVPSELRYAKSHEWVRIEGDVATVGITDYAQDELTDVVFVELPEKGTTLNAGDEFGVVESVKSVSELYAPVSGEVVEVKDTLNDRPELVNESPYGDGWMMKLRVKDPKEAQRLLDAAAYRKETEG
jgi:glycine cleavage system H protein